jgi:outer membrane protein TolC
MKPTEKNHQRLELFSILLTLTIIFLPTVMGFEEADDPDELANRAVAENPGIRALENQVIALKHKIDSVQIWMDPVLGLEFSNFPIDSLSMGDTPMTGIQIKLQQAIPFPGKNDRRKSVALSESKEMEWQLKEQAFNLRAMVKKSYWHLTLVRNLKAITEKHINLVSELIQSVSAKYQVGRIGQHDLLRLEVLQKRLNDDLNDFDQNDISLIAAINSALHRDVSTTIRTPTMVVSIKPAMNLKDLLSSAEANRPKLKLLKEKARTQRLTAEQKAYERWPDFKVWSGYRIRTEAGADPGTDFFTAGISIPLPFDYNNRFKAKRDQHLANAASVEEQYKSTVDTIESQIESTLAAWSRSYQKANTYSEVLVPDAKKTLDAALSEYQNDLTDFASLYQAELQLLEFDRAIKIAESQTRILMAEMEVIVGENPAFTQ